MAVLCSNDYGWVVSHELYIKNTFEKTHFFDEIKSFFFNPALFDIQVPFVKHKSPVYNSNKTFVDDVEVVNEAYSELYKMFNSLFDFSSLKAENNHSARLLANDFYDWLTRHPSSNFIGGNNTLEPLVSKIENELYLIPQKSFFYCQNISNITKHIKSQNFDLILMDPPWWNKYIRRKRKKNCKFGYDMIYDEDLANIPVHSLLKEEGIVAVWCTSAPSHINAILNKLFPTWKIRYLTQWFWLKVTKLGKPVCEFSQTLGKQPFERILFGVKSKSTIRDIPYPKKNKVIMSVPSAIHSHKPPLCELLKPYLPENPQCLELFARYLLPGWTSYGNEVLKLQHMSLYNSKH